MIMVFAFALVVIALIVSIALIPMFVEDYEDYLDAEYELYRK